jgi:VWFA-related protein
LIVRDKNHHAANLSLESLVITDQKSPISDPSLIRGSDLPLELGVLIDISNSQRSSDLNAILQTLKHFVEQNVRGPEDRVFFLKFAVTSEATEWLKREQLASATVRGQVGGGTALFDAVVMACKERMGRPDWQKPTRRIMVLISDGQDNQSHKTREDATREILNAGAVIFAVGTDLSGRSDRGERIIQKLVEVSGGESFTEVSVKDVPKVFGSIQEMMDGMYYLRYVPQDTAKSAVHEVEVKRTDKDKVKLSYPRKYYLNN